MELYDLVPWMPAVALVVAAIAFLARRWIWPFVLGILGLVGGSAFGLNAYRWWADDGGSFEDIEWAVVWGASSSLIGALLGLALSRWREVRRAGPRAASEGGGSLRP